MGPLRSSAHRPSTAFADGLRDGAQPQPHGLPALLPGRLAWDGFLRAATRLTFAAFGGVLAVTAVRAERQMLPLAGTHRRRDPLQPGARWRWLWPLPLRAAHLRWPWRAATRAGRVARHPLHPRRLRYPGARFTDAWIELEPRKAAQRCRRPGPPSGAGSVIASTVRQAFEAERDKLLAALAAARVRCTRPARGCDEIAQDAVCALRLSTTTVPAHPCGVRWQCWPTSTVRITGFACRGWRATTAAGTGPDRIAAHVQRLVEHKACCPCWRRCKSVYSPVRN